MDKALALESSGPGSNPCEGEILFTEEAWKKWARFVIYKKVNKEKGGNHYQTDFSSIGVELDENIGIEFTTIWTVCWKKSEKMKVACFGQCYQLQMF